MAIASGKINKIHCGAFDYTPRGDTYRELDNYVLLNDGSRVSGNKVSWKSGMFVKDQIKIDDQKFAIHDTRGYCSNGVFYGRLGNEYIKRIVHGKLNIYYDQELVTSTTTTYTGVTHSTTRLRCSHYVQLGDLGDLRPLANQGDIKDYVKDCPKAYEMANKSDRQLRRAIRKNSHYLNDIFILYNNDCNEASINN
jgi:hypothetical protein